MDSTAISHCSPRTFTSGLISLQNLNAYGSPQWPFSLVLRGVLRGSLAFPLTGPHTFQSYCIPRWFLLSEGSCHGIDLGPHSPINGETSREMTAKLCTPEFGPTSCPSSLRAPGLGCLPLRKAEFTRISPQLPFSSLSQPTRSSPKWPQHPWTSVTCMPPLLLGISTTISLQYPQYLTWDAKKNPLVRILLFQQYHHLFPVSFLPGIYVQWVTRVQPQDFQMKNPTCQNEDNYPPLFPAGLWESHFKNFLSFSPFPVNPISQELHHTFNSSLGEWDGNCQGHLFGTITKLLLHKACLGREKEGKVHTWLEAGTAEAMETMLPYL